eukprot:gene32263-41814_t
MMRKPSRELRILSEIANEIESPHVSARALARRFEAIGIDPYASDKKRYFVLLDGSGEIIDTDKPLRNSRIFGPTAIRKNVAIVDDFVSYVENHGLRDCYFWSIKLTLAKASCDGLPEALTGFNKLINTEFSELRKRHGFEPLILAIHPNFDDVTGLFDLHAHFICRVPPEHLEDVHIRISTKFSISDLPRSRIRNPKAVVTYMLWGIWRNKFMLHWPDPALKAAWSIVENGFRLARFGGSFKTFRAARNVQSNDNENKGLKVDEGLLAANRAETADPRMNVYETGDRLLTKVSIKREGKRIAALLYEKSGSEQSNTQSVVQHNVADSKQNFISSVFGVEAETFAVDAQDLTQSAGPDGYSAASSAITQEIGNKSGIISAGTRKLKNWITTIFSKGSQRFHIDAKRLVMTVAEVVRQAVPEAKETVPEPNWHGFELARKKWRGELLPVYWARFRASLSNWIGPLLSRAERLHLVYSTAGVGFWCRMKISTLLFPLAFFGSSLPAFAAHYDCAVFSQFSFDIFLSLSGDELAELDTDPGFTFRIAVGKPLSAMPLTALDDLYADYLQCGSEYGEAYRSDGLIAFLNMRTYVIKTTSSVAFESQQSSGLRTLTSPMTSKDPQVSKQDRALDAEFDQLAEKLKTIFVDMSARPNGQKVLKVEEKESFEGFSAQIEKTFSSDSDLRKVGLLAIVRKISDLNSDDQEYIDNAHKSEQAEAEKQAKR